MYQQPTRISRYEIKTLIGAGGMGSLYLARDTNPNTNRLVALKLLNATLDSTELRDRFGREARALAALNHPARRSGRRSSGGRRCRWRRSCG
jgi:serine/threonine protein kinase